MYSFATPPINKTETGTARKWGTTNSKPAGPINMIGQFETLSTSHIIYTTLFSAWAELAALTPATANCAKANRAILLSQNHFPEPN